MKTSPETTERVTGSFKVRSFYDEKGWVPTASGKLLDAELFGDKELGEIRQEAARGRDSRVREALASVGPAPRLIECGCGGNPATYLADLVGSYTAVDFSVTGLAVARGRIASMGKPACVAAADLCAMPFQDGAFDAAYSAHVLYHIADIASQGRAFDEILRIIRPGGLAIFILANPRPLAFPVRLLMRLIADAPGLSKAARRLRLTSPLPYQPMTLSWMRRRLEAHGDVQVQGYAVASTWFNQTISEKSRTGRLLWKVICRLEADYPNAASRLGNYVFITVRKRAPLTGSEPAAIGDAHGSGMGANVT